MKKMLVLAVALAMAMQAVAINSLLDQWLSETRPATKWYYQITKANALILCEIFNKTNVCLHFESVDVFKVSGCLRVPLFITHAYQVHCAAVG